MDDADELQARYDEGALTAHELASRLGDLAEPPTVGAIVARVPAERRDDFVATARGANHLTDGFYLGWTPPPRVRWQHRVAARVRFEWAGGAWAAWPHAEAPRRSMDAGALLACLDHDAAEVRAAALAALAWQAEGYHADAVASLVEDASPLVRGWAAWALGAIGVLEPIAELLPREEPARRPDLACLLVETRDPEVAALLVPSLRAPEVAPAAARVLERLGEAAEPALDAVLEAMEAPAFAEAGARVVRAVGPRAARALPRLEALAAAQPDPTLERWAAVEQTRTVAEALASLGEAAVPALLGLIARPETCKAAVVAASRFGEREDVARALLAAVTEAPGSETIEALGGLGARAAPALPLLLDALAADADHEAGLAIARLGPHAAPLAPALAEALWSTVATSSDRSRPFPERTRWIRYTRALAALGDAAEGPCVAAFADPRADVRSHALDALWSLATVRPETAAAIVPLAADPDVGVRAMAAQLLGCHPSVGSAAALVAAVADAHPHVRAMAVNALARAPAVEALAALVGALDDRSTVVRYGALSALGALGPAARPATAGLVRCLVADTDTVHMHGPAPLAARAAWALGCLGPDADVHGPLVAALADARPEVRLAAVTALARRGGPGVLAALLPLRGDDDAAVRARAVAAIEALRRGERWPAPTPDEVAPWRSVELRMQPFPYNA